MYVHGKRKKNHFLILFYKVRVGPYLHCCFRKFLALTSRPSVPLDDGRSDGGDRDDET